MPDANHLQLSIFRKIVIDPSGDEVGQLLKENSRTSPYLCAITSLVIMLAILFWQSKWLLQPSVLIFCITNTWLYREIIRFKILIWLGR